MSLESIYQALRRLVVVERMEPSDAAWQALQGRTKAQLIDFVLPEVERLARNIARGEVRRIERRTMPTRTMPTRKGNTRPDSIEQLIGEKFMLPGGEFVAWGTATAEQHEARAEWQRGSAVQLVADARRHEVAATLIREAGVACLSEIADWPDHLEAA